MVYGVFVNIGYLEPIGRVCRRGKMRRNGACNLDPRHLATNYENLALSGCFLPKQGLQVPILAAVDDGYGGCFCESLGDDRLSEVARRNQEMLKQPGLLLAPRLEADVPAIPAAVQGLGPHDPRPQVQLKVGMASEIAVQVAPQVLANHPRARELRGVVLPGQVAELHRVLALVGEHQGMDLAAVVGLGGRP